VQPSWVQSNAAYKQTSYAPKNIKRGDLNPEEWLTEHVRPSISLVKRYEPPDVAIDPEDQYVKPIMGCDTHKAKKSEKAVDALRKSHCCGVGLLANKYPLVLPDGRRSANHGKECRQLGGQGRFFHAF